MTKLVAIDAIDFEADDFPKTHLKRRLRRWNVGLCVLGFYGLAAGLGGLTIGFLTIAELVSPSTKLYTCSALLIGGSFILFGLAAHCLDQADALDRRIRLQQCKSVAVMDGPVVNSRIRP